MFRRISSRLAVQRAGAQLMQRCVLGAVAAAPRPGAMCVATRYASHAGLSNAALHELEEEQLRSDKRDQPTAPAGWNASHVPGSSKFRLTKSFEDEKLEIRCTLPETKEGEDASTSSMSNVVLLVQKGSETMRLGLSIEDQELVLDTVSHFKDGAIPKDETPAGEMKRKGSYPGPLIHELDSNFVDQFLSFLEARGVNDDLAVFITEYAFWMEQQEYENWLNAVSTFTR